MPADPKVLADLQHIMETTPYTAANRICLIEADPDRTVLSMEIVPDQMNPYNVLHGGAIYGLADTAAGFTAAANGARVVTQNGSFHFFGNVSEGMVYAEGTPVHRGRIVSVIHVDVRSQSGKLLGEGTFDMYSVDRPFASAENAEHSR